MSGDADFDSSSIVFEVDAAGDYRVGIPIVADEVYENDQSFVVLLELVNSSLAGLVDITTSRRAAICRIIDDDCECYKHSIGLFSMMYYSWHTSKIQVK